MTSDRTQQLSDLHRHLLTGFLEDGAPPSTPALASRLDVSEDEARTLLRELGDDHGAVLHPHDGSPWTVHPFTTSPTAFSVHAGERSWNAPCAWCSLGVAALVGDDGPVRIRTRDGAEGEPLELVVDAQGPSEPDWLIHFPVAMLSAWDNVLYTCSVMLLFTNESTVDDWCRRRHVPRGDVRPLKTFWPFACEWYGRHLDLTWRKWTLEESRALFAKHGLSGPTWRLPPGNETF
ncbi:MAG: alkylmercury lyase family protein [Acidobacteriota bacterium]